MEIICVIYFQDSSNMTERDLLICVEDEAMMKKEKSGKKVMSRKEKNPGNGYKAKGAAEKPLRPVEDLRRKG